MNYFLQNKIKEYALELKPEECCGLIINKDNEDIVYPCQNISFHKNTHSLLNPLDYVRAEKIGNIVGIYHSQEHDFPSVQDNMTAYNYNLSSIIYAWKNDNFYIIEPKLKEYLYKDFKLGENDCFQLIRNYYKIEKNININNYNIGENWYKNEPNIIFNNFKKEGFIEVSKNNLQKDDILLFGKNKERIQHMGIYLNDNKFLHHSYNMKSVIELVQGIWDEKLMLVVRYKYD